MNTNGYANYYAAQRECGGVFQDFIVDLFCKELGWALSVYSSKVYQILAGESRQGVEIKYDKFFQGKGSGRLWIETHEKADPANSAYVLSGINRNAWFYVIGDYDTVFGFTTRELRLFDKRKRDSGREWYEHRENNTKTSLGYFLPISDAWKYAGLVLEPNKSLVIAKRVQDLDKLATEFHEIVQGNPHQGNLYSLLTP